MDIKLVGISWQVRQQLLEIVVMLLGGMTIGLFRTAEQMFVVRLRLCGITAWLEEVLLDCRRFYSGGVFLLQRLRRMERTRIGGAGSGIFSVEESIFLSNCGLSFCDI